MGYWSKHPLGGDTPLDYLCEIEYVIQKKENIQCDLFELKKEDYKHIWNKNIDYIVSMFETNNKQMFKEGCFVVPFKIAELNIIIKDKDLNKKIKHMIMDGDALARGYSIPTPTSSNYPKAPEWNNLKSPFDFAVQLYDLWDELMTEKICFDSLGKNIGLLETMLINSNID